MQVWVIEGIISTHQDQNLSRFADVVAYVGVIWSNPLHPLVTFSLVSLN
jgi:hypothetical protein